MVETRGNLDRVTIADGTLTLEEWAATLGAGSVEGFRVTRAPGLTNLEVAMGLPSPDVKAIHPHLDGAGGCRFRVRAGLNDLKPAKARSSVISLTPLASRQDGRILIHLVEPVLPTPRDEDIVTVGGGDVLSVSNWFLGHFIQLADLSLTTRLDVGCGFGRVAYSLAHYLEPTARMKVSTSLEN